MVMCGGDSTIEPPTLKRDAEGNILQQIVAPDGNVHICKNTSHLYDLAANSETEPLPWFEVNRGDTVEGVFGGLD